MKTLLRVISMLAVILSFVGCASKNPVDYLPQGDIYVGINPPKFYSESGGKRLAEVLKKFNQEEFAPPQADTVLISLKGIGPKPAVYLVMLTKPGAAKQILDEIAKTTQVTSVKAAGLSGYRVTASGTRPGEGSMLLMELSDSALLGALSEKDVENMIAASRKKTPGAVGTPEFARCQSLLTGAPFVAVANVSPFMGSMSLGPLQKANPKAAEALQKVQTVSLTAHWDAQPKVELVAYTPDENAARDLSAFFNFFTNLQRDSLPPPLRNIGASPTKDGLAITLEIPKDTADSWLNELENIAAALPSDPAKRRDALRSALPNRMR